MTQGLAETADRVSRWFARRLSGPPAELESWLMLESGSADKAGIDAFGEVVAEAFATLGGSHLIHEHWEYGNAHSVVYPGPGKVVLLGHLDTVWPTGTANSWTASRRDGWLTGPGVLDMKGGIFVALEALRCLKAIDVPAPPLEVLLTSDEEIGSPWGSELIAQRVGGARACLVFEPGLDDGALKTTRSGVAYYELAVRGSGGHPGHRRAGQPNPVAELATVLSRVVGLGDAIENLSIEPTRQIIDIPVNVIPEQAAVTLDVRFGRTADLEAFEGRVVELLRGVATNGQATMIPTRSVRPPLEHTPRNRWITDLVLRAAGLLGQQAAPGVTAGASDAGFVAQRDVPVIDGLGPWGAGIHAPGEAIPLRALNERGALVALSLALLEGEPR